MNGIIAGASERVLRPPLNYEMVGFIMRNGLSQGVQDPLYVRALYFESGNTSAFLISCDLMALRSDYSAHMCERIAQETGVAASNIIICCTHTHSGPDTMAREHDTRPSYLDFMAKLSDDIAICAREAMEKRQPSRITFYSGEASIQHNRVLNRIYSTHQNQSWEMKNWDEHPEETLRRSSEAFDSIHLNADDMLDNTLLLLRVCPESQPDQPSAFLVNYGCHPVTMGPDNLLYSADFPGYLNLALKQTWPDTPVMFLNGSCGDVNPVKRNTFENAKANGDALAQCVYDMLRTGGRELTGSFSITERDLELWYETDYDDKELARRLDLYRSNLEKARNDGLYEEAKVYHTYMNWALRMTKARQSNDTSNRISTNMKLLRIGDFSIVTFPFELFTSVGQAVREKLGAATMICGYANGDYGYMIGEDLYDIAKYERFESYKFMMYPGPVCREARARVLAALDEE